MSELSITFVMKMPVSLSKKKKALLNGTPHLKKPDLSNLVKAFEDSFEEDSHVWRYKDVQKIWGYEGKIIVESVE